MGYVSTFLWIYEAIKKTELNNIFFNEKEWIVICNLNLEDKS